MLQSGEVRASHMQGQEVERSPAINKLTTMYNEQMGEKKAWKERRHRAAVIMRMT